MADREPRKQFTVHGSGSTPYSVVATCKAHGIDPWAYLRDVLARIPTPPNPRRAELLPRIWKTAQPVAPA